MGHRFIVFFTVLSVSTLGFAKTDSVSETASAELKSNTDIQSCYAKSDSGLSHREQSVRVKVSLEKDGTPKDVKATSVPKQKQTEDDGLKSCIESVIRTLRYPVQAKNQSEIQIHLSFPVKK